MATEQNTMPQYDDRVNEILRGLTKGKSREELAEEFEHTSYKSIDMYMRRRNFTWNSDKHTYIPKVTSTKEDFTIDPSKAGRVLSLMKKEGADIRIIANRLGFKDHQEMAIYMQGKGYNWSSEENTYIKQAGKIEENKSEVKEVISLDVKQAALGGDVGLENFLPLLRLLQNNQDKLLDLLTPSGNTGMIPRYVINGVAKPKTVQMVHSLGQLAQDFADEKNIFQRDLFEVALIDFFKKYGYEHEVEQMLGKHT